MIRRSTVILLFILAALVGLAWFLNHPQTPDQGTPTPTSSSAYLFTPQDGVVNSIKIVSKDGQSVDLERNQDGTWTITQPQMGPADAGLSESSATQVTTLSVVNSLEGGNAAPEALGLKDPSYTFTFKFASGKQASLTVGDQTPIGSGYYAQLDNNPAVIVDKNGIESLLMLLKTPPYALTATPTEGPTELPTLETATTLPDPGTPETTPSPEPATTVP
jgi:hypothetical protein